MGIGISNRAQETYQYQTEAEATKHNFPHAVKLDALSLPSKTYRRDVFEHSDSNRIFTGYDTLDIEEIESIRYKANHTIIHTPSWFSDEAGEELQKVKEEKGTYNGSDVLNAYGFTYARLYAEIEQRYENGSEQWFGLGGEPLTKEKEIEELDKAYESAVDWATKCAEVMAGIQNMDWTSLHNPIKESDRPALEAPKPEQKDLEETKRAFYALRDKYMELYRRSKLTGEPLTRQDSILGHNALLSFLNWREIPRVYTHIRKWNS